jgi:hypothetical protein
MFVHEGFPGEATVRPVAANPGARAAATTASQPATAGDTGGIRLWFSVAAAVLVRPRLWSTALRQWFRSVPRRWWRLPPHLPVPPRAYVAFRMQTAYGPDGHARASDIVEYLEWCRRAPSRRTPAARR